MQSTVYIHFGMRRTGSTAIQVFCRKNAKFLGDTFDMRYLETGRTADYNHNGLFPLNAEKRQAVMEELNNTRSAKILISDDNALLNLSKLSDPRESIEELKNFFLDHPIYFICYLRRYDDYSRSAFNQNYKVRFTHPDVGKQILDLCSIPFAECVEKDMRYYQKQITLLRLLKEHFTHVDIRLFDRAHLKNGNIVDDFFSIAGGDISGRLRPVVNQSMPAASIPYLHSLHTANPARAGAGMLEKSLFAMIHSLFSRQEAAQKESHADPAEINDLIAKTDAILPGYRSLFREREYSSTFPEADITLHDELLFTLLFSLCNELDTQQNRLRGMAEPSRCTGCGMCRDCPSGIDVPKLLSAYDDYVRHARKPVYFFAALGVQPSALILHCGDARCDFCERRCPRRLPVRKRLEDIRDLVRERDAALHDAFANCFGDAAGKRIGIYPSGAYANEMWKEFIKTNPLTNFDVLFFDSNPAKARTLSFHQAYRQEIHPPDVISKLSIHRIVIASDTHYEQIYQSLKHYESLGVEIRRFTLGKLYSR